PWWRGPTQNGIASPKQNPPTEFGPEKNVLWKQPVPGRGHGSPIVIGDQVLLLTADLKHDVQTLICHHRNTGAIEWTTDVHKGGVYRGGNKKASQASTTPACDGERIFVNLLNKDAIYTTALTRAGKPIWQTKITGYVVHQGYGSSPYIYKGLVLVSADNKGGGAIAALRRDNGKVVWRIDRPRKPNYPSPAVYRLDGKDQLLLTGCDLVTSLNPLTGKTYWEIPGATTECVTTTITDGKHIFTSGGYPKNHVSAVRADGSGKVTWRNGVRVYVPSMVCRDGYLYGVSDAGIAHCWYAGNGTAAWRGRLGGTFSASPVMVGDKIYAVNEKGEASVFKTSPKKFELIAKNNVGGGVLSTPAICGSRIYLRIVEKTNGKRQEMLYCYGK
ncbi:MAG: PQQ-binding-like beta-propeller repeat protein, partial [Planctomycetota bacterium]